MVSCKNELEDVQSNQRKAAGTLLILSGALIGLMMPYTIVTILYAVFKVEFAHWVYALIAVGIWINCAINPFIYAKRCPDFRRNFVRIRKFVIRM